MPRVATADLTGRTAGEVVPLGKHLLARVDGDMTVHTHCAVHGRRVCRRCGGKIKRADQGRQTQERITYWCPACQPGTS